MKCQAKSKQSGKQCQKDAVEGMTVCHIHGGKSTGAPIKTGRYSLAHRASLQEKAQSFLNDASPGDLTGELAMMRALLQEYLSRFPEGINPALADIQAMFGMLESIGRTVERIAKILNQTALTQAEVQLLQARLVDLAFKYVDDNKRDDFFADLADSLGGRSGAGAGAATYAISDGG